MLVRPQPKRCRNWSMATSGMSSNKMTHPHQNGQRRTETAAGQHPFAIVLSCSDSRVPPEMVFDQGFGDLFVVRTAGNITDDVAMGSLEYGAEHLHVPLIVVLGHEHCGAVEATLQGGEAPGHIGKIVPSIRSGSRFSEGQTRRYAAQLRGRECGTRGRAIESFGPDPVRLDPRAQTTSRRRTLQPRYRRDRSPALSAIFRRKSLRSSQRACQRSRPALLRRSLCLSKSCRDKRTSGRG